MSQIKIYGLRDHLDPIKVKLADVIHTCIVEALQYPPDKRFHRFFPLAKEDFYYPAGRSEAYTIIEISMMAGRKIETKKRLIRLLFEQIRAKLGISHQDIEITIIESPACNWGFRGMVGDEVKLDYQVEV